MINGNYIAHGMRKRACELATDWVGPRSERELQSSRFKEINQERWTGLDRTLAQVAQPLRGPVDGNERAGDLIVPIKVLASHPQRNELIGRLQRLAEMGLTAKDIPASWRLRSDLEPTLRAMGERGDIIRTMQKALGQQVREMRIVNEWAETQALVIGQVIGKGLDDFPKDDIVEVRTTAKARQSDQTIARLAKGGIYKESAHRTLARADRNQKDPEGFVDAHIRRLEALRRAGIVERLGEGVWHIPANLPERGQAYDAERGGAVSIGLRCHLSIDQQKRALGATCLDQQLVIPVSDAGAVGFEGELRTALRVRKEFLVESGFAPKHNEQIIVPRDLLARLRQHDIDNAGRQL